LQEKHDLSYTDLIEVLGITSTGKLNYHLKVLGDLLLKEKNGRYILTEKGMLASQMLREFPEKAPNKAQLSTLDTLLIGLLGFLLIIVNPFLWGVVVGGILIAGWTGLILYAIFVPALVIWRLAANRTKSHDFYELLKPAIVPALLFTLIFILLFVFNQQIFGFMLFAFLFLGYAPFFGIAVIEAFYRSIIR
jgi:hypothetical protein